MAISPLLDNIRSDRPSLGLFINSPDMVETCAHLGFDCFMIDQMFSGLDWGKTEEMIRTGEAAGITPVLRLQSNPWIGFDHRIAVDVTRAQGIGAQFMLVSNSGKQEIEQCLAVAKDWHRKPMIIHPFDDFGDWEGKVKKMEQETYIIPHVESKRALDELEETFALPGLKMFFIAMTDASKQFTDTAKPDFYHPKLWDFIRRAVELGKKHDVMIAANTSYAYDLEELRKRTKTLFDAGIKLVMTQHASFLFEVAMKPFLKGIKSDLGM